MAVEEEEDGVDLVEEADLAEEAEEDSEEDVEALVVVVVPGDLEEVVVEAVASEEAGDEPWEPSAGWCLLVPALHLEKYRKKRDLHFVFQTGRLHLMREKSDSVYCYRTCIQYGTLWISISRVYH